VTLILATVGLEAPEAMLVDSSSDILNDYLEITAQKLLSKHLPFF
jgi:hypothetical protein